jgi:hypothetical protein
MNVPTVGTGLPHGYENKKNWPKSIIRAQCTHRYGANDRKCSRDQLLYVSCTKEVEITNYWSPIR